MPLLKIATSKKTEVIVKLEESTVKLIDRYALFTQEPSDEVIDAALLYVFEKDKEFNDWLSQDPERKVASTVRIRKPSTAVAGAKNGKGSVQ